MVVVKLTNGLGNQLFQYAAGYALAHRNGVPLYMDIRHYNQSPNRKYHLSDFCISGKIVPRRNAAYFTGDGLYGLRKKVSQIMCHALPQLAYQVVNEAHFHYDPSIEQRRGRIYLVGFWQSEKYFADISSVIRKEFEFSKEPDVVNRQFLSMIESVNAISIHLRRGDYVSDPEFRESHGVCPLSYYREAIKIMTDFVASPHFFVFSDDPQWAKKNLQLPRPHTFVEHNIGKNDVEDLRLMMNCQHHIIANSTFSWWGAWLTLDSDKIVIGPKRWFRGSDVDTSDLFPDSWWRI